MPAEDFTSHESFSHDSIDSFGYDWERIGDPSIAPRRPLKIYLPETTEELVAVVKEARQLGQTLRVRSKGHSSNDLVLADRGVVIGTQLLTGIVALDRQNARVTVRAGTVLAELDEALAKDHLGLKVIGDHNHITAGGFASVGGISPASHRFGLFLDTVLALELVDWQGELHTYTRDGEPDELDRALGATGRVGVIATLTLDLQRVDKWTTLVRNDRFITRDMAKFIAHSWQNIAHTSDFVMERGVWLEFPIVGMMLKLGQFSAYRATAPSFWARLVNRLAYGYLHFLGRWAGRLPGWLDRMVKLLGMLGVIFSPRYASLKNVETFTDRVIDSSVGDPTRMLIVLAPMDRYEVLFRALHALLRDYRDRYGCFTFISFYVKGIHSRWLSRGKDLPFCELMLYLGCDPARLTAERLLELVGAIDQLCIEHGAFRYMHTKTSADPAIRERVDPHAMYAATGR